MSAVLAEGTVATLFKIGTPMPGAVLLIFGCLLLAMSLAWHRSQQQKLGGHRSGMERFVGSVLGESSRWGGVQFLWLPIASRDEILHDIERDAETPDVMLHLLNAQAAALNGAVHWTVIQDQCATEWLQQMLDALSRMQVPTGATRLRQQLFALVFVGNDRPASSATLAALIDYVRGCASVGLVSCTPLPIANVTPAARVASAAVALGGLTAVLIPSVLYAVSHLNPPAVAQPKCQSAPAAPSKDAEAPKSAMNFAEKSADSAPAAAGPAASIGKSSTVVSTDAAKKGDEAHPAAANQKSGSEGKRGSKEPKESKVVKSGKSEKRDEKGTSKTSEVEPAPARELPPPPPIPIVPAHTGPYYNASPAPAAAPTANTVGGQR